MSTACMEVAESRQKKMELGNEHDDVSLCSFCTALLQPGPNCTALLCSVQLKAPPRAIQPGIYNHAISAHGSKYLAFLM